MEIYYYMFEAHEVPRKYRQKKEERMVGVQMTPEIHELFEKYRWENSIENEEGRWYDFYPEEMRRKGIPNWNLQRFYGDAFREVSVPKK